ncbi:aKG-HExxH-type peptide beta-hydroxylase [Hyalangium sp.]|uniref:aKG-HExxH-type peptide beta-hydroxylase n=1 Tax=Hyalangium sp. TaxID=2028555 RepID=UPI002D5B5A3D|nr:HEXXH motif-containing putative peptide modification protein [Hyalangium sp.]HYH99589.1 HEXXH motif-containing putative peptide modification protein [Hyalangium sp.]
MRTWAPDAEASQLDRAALIQVTRSSLLEVVEQAAPERQDVLRALREASDVHLFHPDFFEWYFAVRDRVGEEDEAGFARELDRLEQVLAVVQRSLERAATHQAALQVALDLGGVQETVTVQRANRSAQDMGGSGTRFRVLPEASPQRVEQIAAGLALLQELWPEAHTELAQSVQQLTLFEDDTLKSFADFQRHGSIFMRVDFLKDPVILADYLFHEGSHVRLNTVLSVSPMFLNPSDAVYETPLRGDPRPMFGAFHQMFVLVRIHELYQRLSRRRPEYAEKVVELRSKLESGWQVVREHAQLTESGEAMVSSIGQVLRA